MKNKSTRGPAAKTPAATNGTHGPGIEEIDEDQQAKQAAESTAAQRVVDRDEAQEIQAIMDTMRAEGGQGAYIRLRVKRRGDIGYAYLTKMSLDDFNEENVKQIFGGGDFIAEGRKQNGTVVKTYRFTIDYSIPAKNPDAPKPAEKQSDVASIVKELVIHLVPMLKPAPAQDNSALMIQMMTNQTQMAIEASKSQAQMMTAMFTSMNKSNGADPQITALLARMDRAIEKMADAQGSPKQKSGAAELLELLEVIDRVRDSEPNQDKKGLLAQFGEIAAPIVKAFAAGVPPNASLLLDHGAQPGAGAPAASRVTEAARNPAAAAAAQPGAAAAVPGASADGTNEPPNRESAMDFAFNLAIKQFAAKAIQSAANNIPAEAFAEAAQQQIPPAYDDRIFAIVSAPDWFERIFAPHAGAEQHRAWLTELRDIFVEDFAPETETEKEK